MAKTTAPDIFFVHASPDTLVAERLHALLAPHCEVFLDSICLKPGDVWMDILPRVFDSARLIVALVTRKTDAAYYAESEIASGEARR